jgi:predicted dinucleotide-binding enzyme
MNNPLSIAVLGRGNIGGTLGAKWAAAGHQVVYGVRDPSSSKSRHGSAAAGTGAKVDTIANAIRFGQVVVVAVPSSAVEETVAGHGAVLDGKIVVDATNRFGAPVVNNIAAIAAAAPQAMIYRAFNSIGWENFAEPVVDGEQADLFYCGPEGDSQSVVEKLIADIGLRPVRVGGLETAPLVDNLGSLWVALVRGQHKGRHMAFRLLGG